MSKSTELDHAQPDLAVNGTALDLPTVHALTRYAEAAERAALARTAAYVARQVPAGQSPEPCPAPLHIRIPSPPPPPPAGTVQPARVGRYTGPEASMLMAGTAVIACPIAAVLAHSWAPLVGCLFAVAWLIASGIAIHVDEIRHH